MHLRFGLTCMTGHKTARMASSNTVFRPFCVRAEHSRYFTALISLAIARPWNTSGQLGDIIAAVCHGFHSHNCIPVFCYGYFYFWVWLKCGKSHTKDISVDRLQQLTIMPIQMLYSQVSYLTLIYSLHICWYNLIRVCSINYKQYICWWIIKDQFVWWFIHYFCFRWWNQTMQHIEVNLWICDLQKSICSRLTQQTFEWRSIPKVKFFFTKSQFISTL